MSRVGIGLAAVWLAACAPAPPAEPPAGDPVRGERLFTAACSGYCHATPAGTSGDAPNLWDCEWLHGDADAEIFHTISRGVEGTDMPAFASTLSDADIRDLIAYLRRASRCTQSGSV